MTRTRWIVLGAVAALAAVLAMQRPQLERYLKMRAM
jgi:hypothetical protein